MGVGDVEAVSCLFFIPRDGSDLHEGVKLYLKMEGLPKAVQLGEQRRRCSTVLRRTATCEDGTNLTGLLVLRAAREQAYRQSADTRT